MNKVTFTNFPTFPNKKVMKFLPLFIRAILLLAICLSATAPVSVVSSKSFANEYQRPHKAVIDVCLNPIISTDTTWITGNIYQANCIITVNAGVTLTVQGGAVVEFGGSGYGMRVLGTLVASGSSGSPAVFTSAGDNTANSWYGVVLYENSSANLDYLSVRYGGSGVCKGEFADSVYNNCYGRAQLDVRKGNLTMNHSEVRDGDTDGIVLHMPGLAPSIQNTTIANNTNNNPNDKIGFAVYQTTINMQPTYSNLTFNGNDINQVGVLTGDLNQDVSLGGAPLRFDCGFTSCPIQIPTPYTLTIQPGAILDMTIVNSELRVLSGGTLLVQGTEAAPVSIIKAGIEVQLGGVADLAYCDINGGDSAYYGLEIMSDDVTVSNCTIHDFYLDGINAYAPSNQSLHLNMTDVIVRDNTDEGIYIGTSGGASFEMSLDGGSVSGNGRNGITVFGNPSSLSLKDVVVSGNGFSGSDGSNRNGLYATTNNVSLTLENVQFNNNVNESIYWTCNGSIKARNLSASGNARDALVLAGCGISTGWEWDLSEVGIPVIVSNWIDVNGGGILSIAPGSRLGFESGMNLQVQPDGALYALGTADKPIVFTRAYETQIADTAWRGLENYKGTMILRHCEVSYSNYWSSYGGRGIGIRLDGSTDMPTNTIIQNCKIHDNETGIWKNANIQATTTILYNEIYNNPTFGIDWVGYDPVNAYYNYWGSPTGPYHATLNPGGTGNKVDDNVNFIPFLTEPPEDQTIAGELWVSYGGPRMISPGEINSYAIQYLNLMDHAVEGAVAMIQLPLAATYISSNHGGIYWSARNQVFWLLGDVEVGEQILLSAMIRFDWGLPGSYTDGSIGRFAGTNYLPESLNLDEYNNYLDEGDAGAQMISESAFTALFGSHPDLETLYNTALAEGFIFKQGYSMLFDDGAQTYTAMMRTADKATARMVVLVSERASAITTDGSTFYRIEDLTGGTQANLLTLERTVWGDWAEPLLPNSTQVACNYARCMRNCTLKTISIELMKDTAKGVGAWLLSIPTGIGGLVGVAVGVYETVNTAHDIYVCHVGCSANPLTGCCQAGDVMYSPSFIGGSSRCERYECNATLVSYPSAPTTIEVCPTGSRCVAGTGAQGGCKPCQENEGLGVQVSFGPQMAPTASPCSSGVNANLPSCKDLGIRVAKDPNELFGPVGDVLPDEIMNYRITYENEGAGTAYGVYIINDLPPELDASTLMIDQPNGIYLASEHQIIWYIGTLGPTGDPTSKGEVTYSVGLQPGLAAGTAVRNQATVYFPSVPEETPTNSWTNLVYPLAAIPQELETAYMTPLSITLVGKPAGEMDYALGTLPIGGVLSGTLPELTYTPNEDFTGPDYFTFTVSLEGETSQTAQVTINVTASGDSTPPSVLWTTPDSGQVEVPAPAEPISPNDPQPVYQPIILVKFSENLAEETLTTSNVTVSGPGGSAVLIKVQFDALLRQASILLLEPLAGQTAYTVNLLSSIEDLAGNPLGLYEWEFTTAGTPGIAIYVPLILR